MIETLAGMDVVFRTRSKSHVYTITLFTGKRRGDGKIDYKSLSEGGIEEAEKAVEFKAMDERDLGEYLLQGIRQKVGGNSVL